MRTRPLAVVVGAAIIALPLIGTAQDSLPPRTFSQFVGTWVLDESASTGRLEMAPPVARTLSIATTPEAVTLTKVFSLPPELPGREGKRIGTDHPAPRCIASMGRKRQSSIHVCRGRTLATRSDSSLMPSR
jgi:hypothetical protein